MHQNILEFYQNKRVLVTGHTGFKGTWLMRILLNAGAIVTGYALEPPTEQNLFSISGILGHPNFTHVVGDIRELTGLREAFEAFQPEIVLHLAAQPIVRESYRKPVYTYSVNVMGTVNVLECVRTMADVDGMPIVRSFLNVTTDKVYRNREWCWGYREDDILDGHDPYSNSKSCSELVTHSYRYSFFSSSVQEMRATGKPLVALSTVRAGNVIGGGDFSADRIVPDAVRAMKDAFVRQEKEGIILVRNPNSIRPYQHVLEPLALYLAIAMKQYEDPSYAGCYNVGPDDGDCITTGELMDIFCQEWNKGADTGVTAVWRCQPEQSAPHEAGLLKLDCSKAKAVFGWRSKWHIREAVGKAVEFSKVWVKDGDAIAEMDKQIGLYFRNSCFVRRGQRGGYNDY